MGILKWSKLVLLGEHTGAAFTDKVMSRLGLNKSVELGEGGRHLYEQKHGVRRCLTCLENAKAVCDHSIRGKSGKLSQNFRKNAMVTGVECQRKVFELIRSMLEKNQGCCFV